LTRSSSGFSSDVGHRKTFLFRHLRHPRTEAVLKPKVMHQPLDTYSGAPNDPRGRAARPPDLARTVDVERVLLMHARRISFDSCASRRNRMANRPWGSSTSRDLCRSIADGGNRQLRADRLGPPRYPGPVCSSNERHHHFGGGRASAWAKKSDALCAESSRWPDFSSRLSRSSSFESVTVPT